MVTAVVGLGVCTGVVDGLMLVSVGTAARTENIKELLVGVPTWTVTLAVPATSTAVATWAVNWVSETWVVVTFVADPFHWTVPPVRPLPFTVSVKEAPPAMALVGDSEEMCGPLKVKLFKLMSQAPRP